MTETDRYATIPRPCATEWSLLEADRAAAACQRWPSEASTHAILRIVAQELGLETERHTAALDNRAGDYYGLAVDLISAVRGLRSDLAASETLRVRAALTLRAEVDVLRAQLDGDPASVAEAERVRTAVHGAVDEARGLQAASVATELGAYGYGWADMALGR